MPDEIQITVNVQLPEATQRIIQTVLDRVEGLQFRGDQLIDFTPYRYDPATPYQPNPAYAVNNESYYSALFDFLNLAERRELEMYTDSAGFRTIGIGFNMEQWGPDQSDRQQHLYPIFAAIGIPASEYENVYEGRTEITEQQALNLFRVTLTGRNPQGELVARPLAQTDSSGNTAYDTQAWTLQRNLTGNNLGDHLFSANQLLSLQSLSFNVPGLVGRGLRTAIASSDMEAAQYEIMENSNLLYDRNRNPEQDSPQTQARAYTRDADGLSNRRLMEAALFTNNPQITLPESEFWELVGWACWGVQHELSPNGGSASRDATIVVRVNGTLPLDAGEPPQGGLNVFSEGNQRPWTAYDAFAYCSTPTYIEMDGTRYLMQMGNDGRLRFLANGVEITPEATQQAASGDLPFTVTGQLTQVTCPAVMVYSSLGHTQLFDFALDIDAGAVDWYNAQGFTYCTLFDAVPSAAHQPYPIEGQKELYIIRLPEFQLSIEATPTIRLLAMGVPVGGAFEQVGPGAYARNAEGMSMSLQLVDDGFGSAFLGIQTEQFTGWINLRNFQDGDLGITGITERAQQLHRLPDPRTNTVAITDGEPSRIPEENQPILLAGGGDPLSVLAAGAFLTRVGARFVDALINRKGRHGNETREL